MTKSIFQVLAHDTVRHVIDTLTFPKLSPSQQYEVIIRTNFFDNVRYFFDESTNVIWTVSRGGEKTEGVIESVADVKNHMIRFVEEHSVTSIATFWTMWKHVPCHSSRDINYVLSKEKDDDYTRFHVIVQYDDACTDVLVRPLTDGRRQVTFQFGNDGEVPVAEFYKVTKNHACALKHVKNAIAILLPTDESFLSIRKSREDVLYDIMSDYRTCRPKSYLDELVETAWHPTNLRNVLDENDPLYDRWNI